jgi:hypothetical protein
MAITRPTAVNTVYTGQVCSAPVTITAYQTLKVVLYRSVADSDYGVRLLSRVSQTILSSCNMKVTTVPTKGATRILNRGSILVRATRCLLCTKPKLTLADQPLYPVIAWTLTRDKGTGRGCSSFASI